MEVWCGVSAGQLDGRTPGLIVFPEAVAQAEIDRAEALCPDAVIAAAVLEQGRMRGVIRHGGENRIDYLKVHGDGHTLGSGLHGQLPVYEGGSVAVGMIICRDLDEPRLKNDVADRLRHASAPFKVVAIPAQMHMSLWFDGPTLDDPAWVGLHVALSNGQDYHPVYRRLSFITDLAGRKVAIQEGLDPVWRTLDRGGVPD
jgi:hypothetical protein